MVVQEERHLIQSILTGDRESYSQLIRPHLPRWLRLATALLGNAFDADDAVQNAMIHCYEHLGSFRAEAKFSTWSTKIVLRECYRIQKRRNLNTVTWSAMHLGTVAGPEQTEDLILLQQVVNESLNADERHLFMELFEEGRSVHEVAMRLGASPGAIKTRIWRIRARLKQVLRVGGDR